MGCASENKTLVPAWAAPGLVLLTAQRKPIKEEKGYTTRSAQQYLDPGFHAAKRVAEAEAHLEAGGTLGLCPPVGLLIIDADNAAAVEWLSSLMPAECPHQFRKADKQHWYCRVDPVKFPVYNHTLKIEMGDSVLKIDTRTWGNVDPETPGGGYAVIPPSVSNKDGVAYTWAVPLPPTLDEIPMIPDEVVEVLLSHFTRGKRVRRVAREESRHDRALRYAARAVRYESRSDSEAGIRRVVAKTRAFIEELFEGDQERMRAESADCERYVASAWDQWGGAAALDENSLDALLAEEIASQYGDSWAFCPGLGSWFVWDEEIWWQTHQLSIECVIQGYGKLLLEDALRENDAGRRKALLANANHCFTSKKVSSIAAALKRSVIVEAHLFDASPDLMTFPASEEMGLPAITLNLHTGETYAPRKVDRITLLAGAPYAPGHRDAVVDKWWETSYTDPESRSSVEEIVGVALSGRVHQEKIYSLYGTQGSGKGTLGFSMVAALGDYAYVGQPGMLAGNGGVDGSRKDFSLAGLKGVRVAYFDEFSGTLGEKAKMLSQRGRISAPVKNVQGDLEFDTTHTIFISSNKRQKITGPQGFGRRLCDIPMNAGGTHNVERLDDRIKWHLTETESGMAAMMWRFIEGLTRARANDFHPSISKEIAGSTKEWLEEANLIGEWIAHGCERGDGFSIDHAFQAYIQWMTDQEMDRKDFPYANGREFGSLMLSMGFTKKATKTGTRYLGLRVKSEEGVESAKVGKTGKVRELFKKTTPVS